MQVFRFFCGEKVKPKEKEWLELAKRFKADQLKIYKKGERFNCHILGSRVAGKYGYELIWETEEDHVHVAGDGKGTYSGTHIIVDEVTYLKESVKKLGLAIKCQQEIEANSKKYYH